MGKKKKTSSIRRKLQGEKLKERVEKGRRNATGKQNSIIKIDNIPLWRPKDGEHIVDILPYLAGVNDKDTPKGNPTYTFEYLVHRNVGPGNTMVLCLTEMYDKPCPICEHRQKLREDGADDDVWKPLFAKRRNLYNIICYDRGEEEKGVQIWDEASFYSEKNIMAISKKRGRGGKSGKLINFSDVDSGKSISFTIEPPVSKDDYRSYIGFTFEDREYAIEDDHLESCHCLDELIHIPEYDEIADLYWGSKNRDGDNSKKSKRKSKSSDDDSDVDDLMSQLDDCEDLDDLESFIDENDIDYKIGRKTQFKKAKRELEAMVLEQFGDSDDDDEDEEEKPKKKLKKKTKKAKDEDEEDEDEDEEDQDEDEDEEDEDEDEEDQDLTWKDIKKMKSKELKALIKENKLDVDPDDADDLKDLRQMVAEEMGIDDIPF